MHAAAYALDPKFIEVVKDLDAPCQTGLFQIFTKMAIRDVLLDEEWDISTPELLKVAVAKVNDRYPAVVKRVAQCQREFAAYKVRKSPFNSEAAVYNASNMEPAAWWDLYGGHTPILQTVWRRESWRR